MDLLFYSNHCTHSQRLIHFLAKNRLLDRFSAICVDKRKRGENGQTVIVLENGQTYPLPVQVQEVPSLLQVSQKYRVVVGNEIYALLEGSVQQGQDVATQGNGEPMGFAFSSSGSSSAASTNDYVSATHSNLSMIATPEEQAPKGAHKMGEVSLDDLKMQREHDVRPKAPPLVDFGTMPGNAFMG